MKMGYLCLLLMLMCFNVLLQASSAFGEGIQEQLQDPTYRFVSLPLNTSHLEVQRPYDLPKRSRYSFTNGTHKLWVLTSDKPHSNTSHTSARTEIRIQGYDYYSGIWQFEGHAYVPSGTSGVCIMQIFGAATHATTLMLRVYDGALMHYKRQVLADDIYNKWFRLNVIHDVGAKHVKVYVDGDLKLMADDQGGKSHYFKFGVYTQDYSSFFKESQWRDVKVFRSSS